MLKTNVSTAVASGARSQEWVKFITNSPKIAGSLVACLFSGHLWVYIYAAFLTHNNNQLDLLKTMVGKTAVGIPWNSLVLLGMYRIENGTFDISIDVETYILTKSILFAFVLQLAIWLIIVFLHKGYSRLFGDT